MHRIEAIERLARLRESGAISEAEYEAQKQRLLAQPERNPFPSRLAIPIAAGVALLGLGASAFIWLSPRQAETVRPAPAVTSAAPAPAAARPEPAVQPAKPAETAPATPVPADQQPAEDPVALTRAQLIGHWANPETDGCSGGGGDVTLRSDGSYESEEGGRWRLEGSSLHMTNWGGAPARVELRPNGDLHLTWSYGAEIWRRCPA